MRFEILGLALVMACEGLLAACASPMRFTAPPGQMQQAQRDRVLCETQASSATGRDGGSKWSRRYNRCMLSLGYKEWKGPSECANIAREYPGD